MTAMGEANNTTSLVPVAYVAVCGGCDKTAVCDCSGWPIGWKRMARTTTISPGLTVRDDCLCCPACCSEDP